MKEIGGYFELELPQDKDFPHCDNKLLNSGRHAFEFILRSMQVKPAVVWLPRFTCEVMMQPLERLGINAKFYEINDRLEIKYFPELEENEVIVANNYFGVKDSYMKLLSASYGEQLIIDCAQSYYMNEIPGIRQFYSPRKYFGVPDGGIAVTPDDNSDCMVKGVSWSRSSHLLKRIDLGPSEGYTDFRTNSEILNSESIKLMSNLTKRVLRSVDYEAAREKRMSNYKTLEDLLGSYNILKLPQSESFACAMVYPFMIDSDSLRQRLIDNKIFVATYWPNVLKWCDSDAIEYKLAKYLLPLPIDQRYGEQEMQRIADVILS